MGKQTAQKSKLNGQTPGRLPAFFLTAGSQSGLPAPELPAANMVLGTVLGRPGEDVVRGADIVNSKAAMVTRDDLVAVSNVLSSIFRLSCKPA